MTSAAAMAASSWPPPRTSARTRSASISTRCASQEARENVKKAGVENLVKIVDGDLFTADIHDATVVTLFLLTSVNQKLRPKLLQRPQARNADRLQHVRYGRLEAGKGAGRRERLRQRLLFTQAVFVDGSREALRFDRCGSLGHAVLHGIADHVRDGVEVQLGHQVPAMGLHRARADVQAAGDLFIALAVGQ